MFGSRFRSRNKDVLIFSMMPSFSAKPLLRAGNENEWPNLLPSRISGARVRRERGGRPNPRIVDRVEATSCRSTPTSEVERAKERDPDHNTVLLVPPTSLVPRYEERAGSPERVGQYWIQSECVATRLGPDHLCLHAVLKDPCQKIADQQSVRHFGESDPDSFRGLWITSVFVNWSSVL